MVAYFIRVMWSTGILMWTPAVAYAATLAVTGGNESPFAVPAALFIASLMISTLSGATTLAISIAKELRDKPGQPLVAPWANAIAHMLGSWLAGTCAFVASMAGGVGVWSLLGAVLVASFAGSKGLELYAQKLLPGYMPPKEAT